jgi:hypothetical protein
MYYTANAFAYIQNIGKIYIGSVKDREEYYY